MPPGAVYVGRPSKWGNPFRIEKVNGLWRIISDVRMQTSNKHDILMYAKTLFWGYAQTQLAANPHWLDPLRDKDIVCWCNLSDPCHADVLLELANG